jgi:hypothetical protein
VGVEKRSVGPSNAVKEGVWTGKDQGSGGGGGGGEKEESKQKVCDETLDDGWVKKFR